MTEARQVSRDEVEDFLFLEAELLDDWRLNDWLDLFTEDGAYLVPATDVDPDASPATTLFYVADDRFRLEQRVERLLKKTAHAEYPQSRTRHLVSNIRIRKRDGDELEVGAAMVIYRTKMGLTETYIGHYRYRLAVDGQGPQDGPSGDSGKGQSSNGRLKIREKRAMLDMEGLRPNGRISIIL